MTREEANNGVGVTMENAVKYFKTHCKIFCDDFMKKVPENSIAYQATLTEKGIYDLAIKALEKPSVNETLDKIRTEIEQITDTMGVSYNQYVSKIDVLQIIDKYKAESEEDE